MHEPMDEDMKQAYEMSIDEGIKNLESHLPKEPEINDNNAYNIVFKHGDKTFSRRFLSENLVAVTILIFTIGLG